MIKPTNAPQSLPHDPRLYCDYAQLVRMQAHATSFNLLPNAKIGAPLDGRHSSKLRGRGLNFEELRHYQLGDDIRNLDWKVTLRTGKPHVRGYSEEKDRNVILCVDQRSSMFFASIEVMKSVIAAEVAALIGWRALRESDRVSSFIITDHGIQKVKATRNQGGFLAFLKKLSKSNLILKAQRSNANAPSLSNLLQQLSRLGSSGNTIFILSDLSDMTEIDIDRLHALQRNNDIIPIIITDPIEQALPSQLIEIQWRVGDGDYQISLDSEKQRQIINQSFSSRAQSRAQNLSRLLSSKKLPLIELTTDGEHIRQFTQCAGGHA
ncbi:DUF58 domain-containing protein [Vibrio astriarenae]|uniref:DUF58 domain-containing protein n=1 Tax=Vibrio astriarenae TaxID=1481923 RepID=UPI003734D1A8